MKELAGEAFAVFSDLAPDIHLLGPTGVEQIHNAAMPALRFGAKNKTKNNNGGGGGGDKENDEVDANEANFQALARLAVNLRGLKTILVEEVTFSLVFGVCPCVHCICGMCLHSVVWSIHI